MRLRHLLVGIVAALICGVASATETLDLSEGDSDFTITVDTNSPVQVSVGDWNGDGYYDLAVGDKYADVDSLADRGCVYVFFGPVTLGASVDVSAAGLTVCGASANDHLTLTRRMGDFDGDGTEDLILRAYDTDADADGRSEGSTYVIPGRTSWPSFMDMADNCLPPAPECVIGALEIRGHELSGSGTASESLVAGDLDDDGLADLIIRDPGASGSRAKLAIFPGLPRASWPDPPVISLVDSTHHEIAGEELGSVRDVGVAIGDFNNDEVSDLLLGAPTTAYGNVFLLAGPLVSDYTLPGDHDLWFDSTANDTGFGWATELRDLNHDGFADIIIGEPGYNSGRVNISFGRPLPWTPGLSPASISGPLGGVNFGQSLATGDTTGDGEADLLVGRQVLDDNPGVFGLGSRSTWPDSILLDNEEADLVEVWNTGSTYDFATGRDAGANHDVVFLSRKHDGVVAGELLVPKDLDSDGISDWGDLDDDGDGVDDEVDVCPKLADPLQADTDSDGVGDLCDNCPFLPNPGQEDADDDGLGDDCDDCPFDADNDIDSDGVCGNVDNCPGSPNPTQADADSDGVGDACDSCPLDADNDIDSDGVCGGADNCPDTPNPGQEDSDSDGVGDPCDNCPDVPNPDQEDDDGDGIGDVCESPYYAIETLDPTEGDSDFTIKTGGRETELAIGDWNHDGFYDLALGDESGYPYTRRGAAYVFFGPLPPDALVERQDADLTVYGPSDSSYLTLVQHSGDFDGDGMEDLILQAWGTDADSDGLHEGSTYVIPGRENWPPSMDLEDNCLPPTPGCQIGALEIRGHEEAYYGSLGLTTGDLNDDGLADLIVRGACDSDCSAPVHVVLGMPRASWPGDPVILLDDAADHEITGDHIAPRRWGGVSVGDFDNDGVGDLLLGSPDYATDSGAAFLLFGPLAGDYSLPGDADLTIYSDPLDLASLGWATVLRDLNFDGFADVVVGAPGPADAPGEVDIVFGSTSPPSVIDLSADSPDVRILGRSDSTNLGTGLAAADSTGDGEADLFVGGNPETDDGPGVYGFGGRSTWPAVIDLNLEDPDMLQVKSIKVDPWSIATGRDTGADYSVLFINTCYTPHYPDHAADLFVPKDLDSDGTSDWGDSDDDGDGVNDDVDVCPKLFDPAQADADGDGVGDLCENCVDVPNPTQKDTDGDGLGDACDNCPDDPDPDQTDGDSDGVGDLCDNCLGVPNPDQEESDGDGLGDACDNCPLDPNFAQDDWDSDGAGDVCDPDDDNDGILDATDNCPLRSNPGQEDSDSDGIGDVCDFGSGGEIFVTPDGSPSLTEALAFAAITHDRIRALPGTYVGRFIVEDGVELIGSGAEVTILDGQDLGDTVTMNGLSLLEGFTVTGGDSAGIRGYESAGNCPSVTRSIIRQNYFGVRGDFSVLSDLLVEYNSSSGAYVYDFEEISNCRFLENAGGGVSFSSSLPGGGAIRNNLFVGNTGTAVGIYDPEWPFGGRVEHNVIIGNGAGIADTESYEYGYFSPRAFGNIIANNVGYGVRGTFDDGYEYLHWSNNNLWNNDPNYTGVDQTGMNGNISADPLFRDAAAGDYRLLLSSPCIDAGPTLDPPFPDRDGIPRPLDGNLDGTTVSDIGAYEDRGEVLDLVMMPDKQTVRWEAHPAATSYSLYRADLAVLRAGGGYTQDPGTVPLAWRWCDLATPEQWDSTVPPVGEAVIYLATPVGMVEGSLGFDSVPLERPNDQPCP